MTTFEVASGHRPYPWAAIEAPPGVRLRALALHLAAGWHDISDDAIRDLVTRTQPLRSIGGDTFVSWDGSLWLAPAFPGAFQDECPSHVGDEIYDALTLDRPSALRDMLAGLPPPIFSEARERGIDINAPMPVIPEHVRSRYRAIVGHDRVRDSESDCERFIADCAARASDAFRPQLAARVRRAFPDAYQRQRRALQLVGRDIDEP